MMVDSQLIFLALLILPMGEGYEFLCFIDSLSLSHTHSLSVVLLCLIACLSFISKTKKIMHLLFLHAFVVACEFRDSARPHL